MSTEYQPGQCNIGPGEQRKRRTVGWVGFGAAALLVAIVVGLSLPRHVLLLAIAPLFGGFLGIFQARAKFCAGFAVAGIYRLADGGDPTTIEDGSAKRADRRRAAGIVLKSMVAASLSTIALYGGAIGLGL